MNQKTTIAAIVLATIMAASGVVMGLPFESAQASNTGGAGTGGPGGAGTGGDGGAGGAGTGGNGGAGTGGSAE